MVNLEANLCTASCLTTQNTPGDADVFLRRVHRMSRLRSSRGRHRGFRASCKTFPRALRKGRTPVGRSRRLACCHAFDSSNCPLPPLLPNESSVRLVLALPAANNLRCAALLFFTSAPLSDSLSPSLSRVSTMFRPTLLTPLLLFAPSRARFAYLLSSP